MIRPFTIVTLVAALGSGAYLFAVKHRAQVLDDQISAVAQASQEDAQRIRVLQAQWALEIDPTRLSQLAGQFTTLQPMKPAQLVALASLKSDLPEVGADAPETNPENDSPVFAPPVPMLAAAVPMQNGLPLPPDAAPPPPDGFGAAPVAGVALASAAPVAAIPAAAPAPTLAAAHAAGASHLGNARLAANTAPPRPLYATPPAHHAYNPDAAYVPPPGISSPEEIREASIAAPAAPAYTTHYASRPTVPMGAQLMSVRAVAAAPVSYAPARVAAAAPAADQNAGSALAMAADLAPPRPLDGNN